MISCGSAQDEGIRAPMTCGQHTNPLPSAVSGGGGAEASQPPRIILQGSLDMPASAGKAGNTRVDSDTPTPTEEP